MMEHQDRPSKTQRKQAMHDLQALGAQLVELRRDRLDQIDLPAELLRAVLEAKRVTAREARRRQLQYIGRLMRDVDATPIRAKFDSWNGQSNAEKALHHNAERWRDQLLAGGDAMTKFASQFRGYELQPLRNLVRAAMADASRGKPPRHNREIYRMVRGMIDGLSSNPVQARGEVPDGTESQSGEEEKS
jgi:ribosome-associated protein